MILIDTSIWVTHFKHGDPVVSMLLADERILVHSWIIGELAMGVYADRGAVLRDLQQLPRIVESTHDETMSFIEANALFGTGIGYIDAALLAATKLTPGTRFWSRDKRLQTAAARLSVEAKLDS